MVEPGNRCRRLVLGTAQLGMNYGIANRTGKPALREAESIIRTAWKHGIRCFDTARAYGKSEEVLGEVLAGLGLQREIKIISKLDPEFEHLNDVSLVTSIRSSLKRLGVPSLYCLMLHREKLLDLLEDGLRESLQRVSEAGLVQYFGVSVYTPERARQALQSRTFDLLQLPASIFDGRFRAAGIFRLATSEKKTIFIRSIFLQGLLLMDHAEVPARMAFAGPALAEFDRISRKYGLSRSSAALGYVRERYPNAYIIFGAERPEQVEENLANWEHQVPEGFLAEAERSFRNLEERIINPLLWPAVPNT